MDVQKTRATEKDYSRGFLPTQRSQALAPSQPDIKIVMPPPKNFVAWLVKISHRQTPPTTFSEGQPFPDRTNKE